MDGFGRVETAVAAGETERSTVYPDERDRSGSTGRDDVVQRALNSLGSL
jgi:hypothetical protein